MESVEQMINRLCPEGVEFAKIGETCSVGTGSSNRQDASENGQYPFFVRSKEVLLNNSYEFDEEAILIPGEGGIGDIFHYYKGKYALHQRTYRIHPTSDAINTKFLYYYMYANFKKFILMKAVSATVTSIRKPMIDNFPIPIPPMEIQNRIVEVLDKMTTLTAELEAELEARKQQYEYYRNKLLTFNEIGGGIRFMKLGEVGKFYGGLSGKSKKDFVDGNAKFITYMNVYSNPSLCVDVEDKVFIKEGERQNTIQYGDILFTGSSETPNECGMSSVLTSHVEENLYLNSFCFGYRFDDLKDINPNFMKHLFRSSLLRKAIAKTANGVTRFNVSKKLFAEIEIPLPPMEIQKRITSILDRFEALTTDLQSGLPAEIEARRHQYEYYRNKLLTFDKIA